MGVNKKTLAETIGKRLDNIMTERDIKGKELAQQLEVPESTISKWRHGAPLSLESLVSIARELDVPLDYLVGLKDQEDDDEAKEITALFDILKIDLLKGTLTIPRPLVEYLISLKAFEETMATAAMDETTRETLLRATVDGLQKEYKKRRGGGFDVTYTLYKSTDTTEPPKDYLKGPYRAAMMRNTPGPR